MGVIWLLKYLGGLLSYVKENEGKQKNLESHLYGDVIKYNSFVGKNIMYSLLHLACLGKSLLVNL